MKKRIWILSLFPEYFEPLLNCGIAGSALRGERNDENFSFEVHCFQLRDYSKNKYKSVDDSPYGGGPGMIMRADVLRDALQGVVEKGNYSSMDELEVIYTSPRGKVWDNKEARDFGGSILSQGKDPVFICGRYEGIDERFIEKYVSRIYSLGDYVLTGGEIAVLAILDSAVRFVPGVLGNKVSANEDSFEDGLLECPQYTRPAEFEEMTVPEVLSGGNHKKIVEWQEEKKMELTKKLRPDLLKK
jgi:tRNA (guanine37-N1)-methyltransferase